MGVYIEDSLSQPTHTHKMYKLVFAALLATAAAIPIDDTADVAAAKAAFQAAFDDAAAGGLAAKQAPAPVHEVPVPAALPLAAPNALPFAGYPYGVNALNVLGAYPGYAAGLPYATNIANIATYPYAGLPVIAAAPAAKSA